MPEEAKGKTGRPSPARNKPERPRDLLGRPLSWESANQLHLADFDSLSTPENHRLALQHARAGEWFPAHEAWETAWKQSRDTSDSEFFKGLAQMGAGFVHLLRGNAHGAKTLLRRAAGRLAKYPDPHWDIHPVRLSVELTDLADAVEEGKQQVGEDVAFRQPSL